MADPSPDWSDDLKLARRALAGEAEALKELDAMLADVVPAALARSRVPRTWADEVAQRVRAKLLVAPEGEEPLRLAEVTLGQLGRVTLDGFCNETRGRMKTGAERATRIHDDNMLAFLRFDCVPRRTNDDRLGKVKGFKVLLPAVAPMIADDILSSGLPTRVQLQANFFGQRLGRKGSQ